MNEYEVQALAIVNEWNAMTGAEQHALCRNCVLKAIRGGRKLAHGDELDDAINNTYIDVRKRLADPGKLARNIKEREGQGLGDSLPGIVSRTVKTFLQREIDREELEQAIISDTTICQHPAKSTAFSRPSLEPPPQRKPPRSEPL